MRRVRLASAAALQRAALQPRRGSGSSSGAVGCVNTEAVALHGCVNATAFQHAALLQAAEAYCMRTVGNLPGFFLLHGAAGARLQE